MPLTDLKPNEYNPYYQQFLDKIKDEGSLIECLQNGAKATVSFFNSLTDEQWMLRYAPEKWTPKEVLQHLIDTERIFSYRGLRIGRRDTTALAGFDQDIYVEPSGANAKSAEQLLEEYRITRDHTLSLAGSLSDEDLAALGHASDSPVSARAVFWITIAHEIWHIDIIKERYL